MSRAAKPAKGEILYTYRGQIEKLQSSGSSRMVDAYSEGPDNVGSGGVCFPWMTREECMKDASRRGYTSMRLVKPPRGYIQGADGNLVRPPADVSVSSCG